MEGDPSKRFIWPFAPFFAKARARATVSRFSVLLLYVVRWVRSSEIGRIYLNIYLRNLMGYLQLTRRKLADRCDTKWEKKMNKID